MEWLEQNDTLKKNEDIFVVQKTGIYKKYWKKYDANIIPDPIFQKLYKAEFDIKIAEWHKFDDAFIIFDFGNTDYDALEYINFPFNMLRIKNIKISFNETVVETPDECENLYSVLRPYISTDVKQKDMPTISGIGNSYSGGSFKSSNKKIQIHLIHDDYDNGKIKFALSEFSSFFQSPNFLYESRIKFEFTFCDNILVDAITTASYSNLDSSNAFVGLNSSFVKASVYFQLYDLHLSYAHLLNKYLSSTALKFNVTEVKRSFVIGPTKKNTLYRGNINVNTHEFDSLCIYPVLPFVNAGQPLSIVTHYKFSVIPTAFININILEQIFNQYCDFHIPVFYSKFIMTIDDKIVINYEKDNFNMNFIEYLYKYHKSIVKFPFEYGPLGYYHIPLIFEFSRFFIENGYRNKLTNDKNIKFEFSYYSDINIQPGIITGPDFHFLTINTKQFSYLNGLFYFNKEF